MAGYTVPTARATAELREKGSRFLAVVEAAADEAAARAALDALARLHSAATHLCWASRLGWPPRERSSDAGEPAGTAGVPMLQVLRGAALSDVMAVVVRWYGGVNLGKGGLARAYAATVRAAVADLPTVRRVTRQRLHLEVSFDHLGAVKRLVRPPAIEIESERYGDVGAQIDLAVDEAFVDSLTEALADLRITPRADSDRTGANKS
jgi:uncharacterized YigZ family protein